MVGLNPSLERVVHGESVAGKQIHSTVGHVNRWISQFQPSHAYSSSEFRRSRFDSTGRLIYRCQLLSTCLLPLHRAYARKISSSLSLPFRALARGSGMNRKGDEFDAVRPRNCEPRLETHGKP